MQQRHTGVTLCKLPTLDKFVQGATLHLVLGGDFKGSIDPLIGRGFQSANWHLVLGGDFKSPYDDLLWGDRGF